MISLKKVVLALPFVLQFLYVLQGIFVFPFATGDAYSSWIFKGNVLYLFGWSKFLDFLADPVFSYIHPSYPILFPLLVAGIYHLVGGVQELAILAMYPLLYLVMVIAIYRLLKPLIGKGQAYLAAFFWATVPVIERHAGRFEAGFVDLPLSFCLFVGTVGLYHWVFFKNQRWLLVSLIFLIAGTHLKYEGILWLLSLLVAGMITLKKNLVKRLLIPLGIGLISIVPWLVLVKTQNFSMVYVANISWLIDPHKWLRLGLVVKTGLNQLKLVHRWSLSLLSLGAILALQINKLRSSNYWFLAIAVGVQLLGYGLIFVVTPLDVISQLESSFYRLVIQVLPFLLWLGLGQLKGKDEAKIAD